MDTAGQTCVSLNVEQVPVPFYVANQIIGLSFSIV